jgi:NitT/TauT family transport system permease protein
MTKRHQRRLLWTIVVLTVWQAVCASGLVSPILLASPFDVYLAATRSGSEFLSAFRLTALEALAAIAIAWVCGVAVGATLGRMPMFGRAVSPVISSLLAVPLIIWYPYFIVWLGIGPQSKIAYAALYGFFPIALNTLNAVQLVDQRYLTLARSIGASTRQTFFRIVVVFALPGIVSGLRIGTSLVVIGVIVAEMLASVDGLGFLISYHRTSFDTGHVYLGILLAVICALAVNWALSRIECKIDRWRDPLTN